MKIENSSKRHIFEICLGLIASALLLASGASAAVTTYSITGHVTTADNTGISGITVCTYSNNVCQTTSTPTDDFGKYTITGLKKATYSVKVNVDDRGEQYFFLPSVNPVRSGVPNIVSAVNVVSSDVPNVDFKKIEIKEAVSGFQWPMTYDPANYGSTFGQYMDYIEKIKVGGGPYHNGQDYNSKGSESNNGWCKNGIEGSPIHAVADGIVVDTRTSADNLACNGDAYGAVTIKHWYKGKAYYSNYLHMSLDRTNPVKPGDKVDKGAIIGSEDRISNFATAVHLHFEIKNSQNPEPYNRNQVKDVYAFDNLYKWYEHSDAFIASSVAYVDYPTIVVDERELLYSGEDPYPSRWFTVNDKNKFTDVPLSNDYVNNLGFGGHMQYAITTADSTPSAWGKWSFDTPKEGNYEIFAYIPRFNGESEKAVYKIDGNVISPSVDQSTISDDWIKIGDLHYLSLGTHSIQLDNNVGEVGKKLAYDAIKVVYKDTPSIILNSPVGGEVVETGSELNIQWSYFKNPGEDVSIEILKNGVEVYGYCPAINTGSSTLTIPESFIQGEDYQVRVTAIKDGVLTEYSDTSGYFSIVDTGVCSIYSMSSSSIKISAISTDPCTPPPPTTPMLDLVILVDTTYSMWDDIDAVKAAASEIVQAIDLEGFDSRVAIADYRDRPEWPYGNPGVDYVYNLDLPFSNDTDSIITAINGLSLGDGVDTPESVYSALVHTMEDPNKDMANSANFGWRNGATKAIIIMADAPPHQPEPWTGGHTLTEVISVSESIDPVIVYSVVIGSSPSTHSAFAEISDGTNGRVYTSPQASDVVAAIIEAIGDIGAPENRGVLVNITPSINEVTAGNSASYSVNVTNIGSLNDIYNISTELNNFVGFQRGYPIAIQPSWVNFNSAQIALDPGMSETRLLTVTVPQNWAGMEDVTYSFNVTATSTTNTSIGNTSSAELKVKADKRSMAEYSKLEIHWLRTMIQGSKIDSGIKNALLSKLANAESKVDVAIANVGNSKFGSNLNTAENMMTAFNNQVEAQYDKKIMQPDAAEIKNQGNQIIVDLEKAKNS